MSENLNLKNTWDEYYTEENDTALKDKSLFKLEIDEIERHCRSYLEKVNNPVSILELGSGTGFLIETLSRKFQNYELNFTGVDFSEKGIERAKLRNVEDATFIKDDFNKFLINSDDIFDIIITQRSMMALMSKEDQDELILNIYGKMNKCGIGLFSECLDDSLDYINDLRANLDVEPLEKVWHSRYLNLGQFNTIFSSVDVHDFASMYYLITRVIYPHFESPVHNSKIAEFAAELPQLGKFGLVKLIQVKK